MTETSSQPKALITGAAGGLGSSLIHAFQQRGFQVIATWNHNPIDSQVPLLDTIQFDVANASQVKDGFNHILQKHGPVNVLVNNAGMTRDASAWQLDIADWDKVVSVNLTGAYHCCRAVLPTMLRQRLGHIINIASFSGKAGQRGQAAYASAKAGLLGLTASLAQEVGSRNICVNAVLPGVLPTPMTKHLSREILESFAASNALKRLNDPQEVAQFIAFLAGMHNVSGQCFQLDSRITPWS